MFVFRPGNHESHRNHEMRLRKQPPLNTLIPDFEEPRKPPDENFERNPSSKQPPFSAPTWAVQRQWCIKACARRTQKNEKTHRWRVTAKRAAPCSSGGVSIRESLCESGEGVRLPTDLRGSPGTSGEVWGTSGEVWETSGEPLDCC